MLEAAIIGRWRSTPGLFWIRRRILLLRRFNWRWTVAFTRKPPGGEWLRGVKYLDYSLKPGGFRASRPRSASNYAWIRPNSLHAPPTGRAARTGRPARVRPGGSHRAVGAGAGP